MKSNKIVIGVCIGIIVVILIVLGVCALSIKSDGNGGASKNTTTVPKTNDTISLNEEAYIDTLKKVNIVGTNDYVEITDDVKWDVPHAEDGEMVDYSMVIPYAIIIDGKKYNGSYVFGMDNYINKDDKNPKYNIEITNLTKSGKVRLILTEK